MADANDAPLLVIRDLLNITPDEVREVFRQWAVCRNDISRFLRTRGIPSEWFFSRVRELGMLDLYYETRASWMQVMDRDLVQKSVVVALKALENGSETMAQWILSRRCGILFGTPDEQDKILNNLKRSRGLYSGGDQLDPEHLGIRLLPQDSET